MCFGIPGISILQYWEMDLLYGFRYLQCGILEILNSIIVMPNIQDRNHCMISDNDLLVRSHSTNFWIWWKTFISYYKEFSKSHTTLNISMSLCIKCNINLYEISEKKKILFRKIWIFENSKFLISKIRNYVNWYFSLPTYPKETQQKFPNKISSHKSFLFSRIIFLLASPQIYLNYFTLISQGHSQRFPYNFLIHTDIHEYFAGPSGLGEGEGAGYVCKANGRKIKMKIYQTKKWCARLIYVIWIDIQGHIPGTREELIFIYPKVFVAVCVCVLFFLYIFKSKNKYTPYNKHFHSLTHSPSRSVSLSMFLLFFFLCMHIFCINGFFMVFNIFGTFRSVQYSFHNMRSGVS